MSAESDAADISELGRIVMRYELADLKDLADFDRYVRAEGRLENHLMRVAERLSSFYDIEGACRLLDQVLAFNQTLRRKIDDALPLHEDDRRARAELGGWRDEADGVILLIEGMKAMFRAQEHTLKGHVRDAERLLSGARANFERLRTRGPGPLAEAGAFRHALAGAHLQLSKGVAKLQSGDTTDATERFARAHIGFARLLDDPERAAAHGDVRELHDLADRARALQRHTEFLRETKAGEYALAIRTGEEAVKYYERLAAAARAPGVPKVVRNLRGMEHKYVLGLLMWCRAEKAVEDRDWRLCDELIAEAHRTWRESVYDSLLNEDVGAASLRPQLDTLDMMLQGTRRRRDSEERHQKQIARLEEELGRLRQTHIWTQGGTAMAGGDHHETINVNGPVTGVTGIGSHARASAETVNIAQPSTGSLDLAAVRAELADLREALADLARTPAQQAVVAEVARAEEAAQVEDESRVRRHLAAAGEWALETARLLGQTAVEAVIKTGLGA
ncbi:unnamed protein product [[Actinomadura] parvosata subsp. kistnae]|uniref:Uncharacterized protein n=1 Tax=[Actinomadura] parvosata subsp. kistnae TaxID=1909395 RepID=A0A1U9ZY49_9ACTN|nr:hypothetical protein [Nonomuraea sp. ATCC 55076]AQZ62860.1 hypothetical protein BKM31_16590 [Nonomuraea sp. ATCC 55076]SPL98407.1 unnamed protein product [Actinomadura parvosata subsp. kistnae]